MTLRIFFDGGCRPNPGAIEVAAVGSGIVDVRCDVGRGDNNDAEWLALIHAARIAVALGAQDVIFLGDSALVVGQAGGIAKCRGARLQAHLEAYRSIIGGIGRVRVRRVPRAKNLAGIELARLHPR